jgi:2-oxoglutarate dehydrogenase E2 component (dihydrolipoamide succinyltransferase)
MIEIKVPSPGESITQVQLARWLVTDGDIVEKNQEIAEIDSDKATLSISAEEDGKIKLLIGEGETVDVGSVIATIDTEVKEGKKKQEKNIPTQEEVKETKPIASENKENKIKETTDAQTTEPVLNLSPLARKLMQQNNLTEAEFLNFLKSYRVGKKDVEFFISQKDKDIPASHTVSASSWQGARETERKKMSTLRLKLSERLVAVKNETAMLTTFNEVNMTPIMEIRKKYKDKFKEKHGIGLGFMSFFTKAVTEALQIVPGVNAQIDKDEIVYFNYADIGIAVSSPKGLMVPVLRNAEKMTLAEIEIKIKELADKARTNKITIDEMTGGTFTITNGGVFGSMLSTPILNPPQSAILGMHNIVERPVAINGKVEIHPVMYLALSYDHRVIDGRESVTFLVKVKEMLENPVKMLFTGEDPLEGLLGLK